MSLSRSLFNEFRPFFRLFDEVSHMRSSHPFIRQSPFDRRFDDFVSQSRHPVVDLSEQGNEYIIEAEVPGIKKENLEVRVGDNGRSLTIEGRTFTRSSPNPESTIRSNSTEDDKKASNSNGEAKVVPTSNESAPTLLSSEREIVGSSHFTRTVWLPRPVDASKVSGSLTDGILTLRIPKVEEQGSFKVNIQ